MNSNDEKSAPLACSICGKRFSNEKQYFGHLRIHSGQVLWCCERCPSSRASFDSQSRLKIHENSCHSLVRPYKCSKCENVFDRASQLDYHRRSVHLREKSQICQICGKGFFRKNDLQTHLNVHLGTNQSICEICGRKFNHVSNLIRHCRTHAGSKPYPCHVCGKRFTQISSLARHKRTHERKSNDSLVTGKISDEQTNNKIFQNFPDSGSKLMDKKMTKRQHYCKTCGESFQFMVLLRQHERLHAKIREERDEKIPSNSVESSTSNDWRDIENEKITILDEPVANSRKQVTLNNSIDDNLMELAEKMTSVEIETQRDVGISISDILSPYSCNEIELTNGDTLEPKLYETSANKESMDKNYDTEECLNGVDFESNVTPPGSSIVKSQAKMIVKSLSRQQQSRMEKSACSTRDRSNRFLQNEASSQLYVEICESDEYLKSSNMRELELEEIENVDTFREGCFDPGEEGTSRIETTNLPKSLENNEDARVDEGQAAIDTGEPTLRLVKTETGEQFYELVVNNRCNDFDNQVIERNSEEFISQIAGETAARLSICGDDGGKLESQIFHKSTGEPGSSESLQSPENIENYREIPNSLENEAAQMPMVRLVQNEDGEQFFELVREPLEYEKNRVFDESYENSSTPGVDSADDSSISDRTRQETTIVSNPGAKRERKENGTESAGQRTTKDRTRKFQCNECDKWFSTSYNFKQHAGTHFSDQQKFQCKDCGLSFAWKSTLNKHLAGNHRPDGPQKFVCEICPKVYSTLSQVNEHVKRDHLKERNHVCTLCGKSFFKKFDLKTHARTHTNERPYICRACGKGFHHQSHIIRHERIHSGERPYECNICQRTFTQPGSLKSHRQRHRDDIKIDILEYRMDEDDPLTLAVQ